LIIQYTPANGEPEQYDARSLRTSEASIAQRTAGMKWGEIESGLETDDPEAMRVIAWVLKKRVNPALRYSEFDPLIGEMTTRMDQREVTDYVENTYAMAETNPDVSRDDVAQVLQRIVRVAADPEHAERAHRRAGARPKRAGQRGRPTAAAAAGGLQPLEHDADIDVVRGDWLGLFAHLLHIPPWRCRRADAPRLLRAHHVDAPPPVPAARREW
jgi:hypothetical protein